jgi:hypothetical protein
VVKIWFPRPAAADCLTEPINTCKPAGHWPLERRTKASFSSAAGFDSAVAARLGKNGRVAECFKASVLKDGQRRCDSSPPVF